MNILYLTTGFPYPLTSGYLRHYFFIRELAARHQVTLLSFAPESFEEEHLEAMRPLTKRVAAFPRDRKPRAWMRKAARRLQIVTGRMPALRRMCRTVQTLVEQEQFDAVVACGKEILPVLRHVRSLPLVMDVCDAASVRTRDQITYAPPHRRPWLLAEYARLKVTELCLIRQAQHVLFAAPRDCQAFAAEVERKATVIPNGVDLGYWKRSRAQLGSNTIVFTGAMSYGPNADAAHYLVEEIFPAVRKSLPQARLLIVGRAPAAALQQAGRAPGVTVTGAVDDMRPYLEQATMFAAPLRFGAGIQNKLLEALAMELPVVTSPLAAHGLTTEQVEQPPLTVAHNTEQFVEAIVRELHSRRERPGPEPNARAFVARHFDWKRSGEKLERVLQEVAARGRVGTPQRIKQLQTS